MPKPNVASPIFNLLMGLFFLISFVSLFIGLLVFWDTWLFSSPESDFTIRVMNWLIETKDQGNEYLLVTYGLPLFLGAYLRGMRTRKQVFTNWVMIVLLVLFVLGLLMILYINPKDTNMVNNIVSGQKGLEKLDDSIKTALNNIFLYLCVFVGFNIKLSFFLPQDNSDHVSHGD